MISTADASSPIRAHLRVLSVTIPARAHSYQDEYEQYLEDSKCTCCADCECYRVTEPQTLKRRYSQSTMQSGTKCVLYGTDKSVCQCFACVDPGNADVMGWLCLYADGATVDQFNLRVASLTPQLSPYSPAASPRPTTRDDFDTRFPPRNAKRFKRSRSHA